MVLALRTLVGVTAVAALVFSETPSAGAITAPAPREIERALTQGPVQAPPVSAPAPSSALRGPIDPQRYVVGPGDGVSITLWGRSVVSFSETVTPEGELVLPGMAPVQAAGSTLAELKRDLVERLSTLYHDMDVSISLTELREMEVSVLGAVTAPGAYVGTALTLAGELIKKSGGVVEGASERNIAIMRRDGTTSKVDLVRYRHAGDLDANPPILDGDVIFVPFAKEYVYVYGAVQRPGRYELVPGETVGSLLVLAGGLARGAVSEEVELRRFVDDLATEARTLDVAAASGPAWVLADGDQVYVQWRSNWRPVRMVLVDGEVKHPGFYGINEGTDRLSDVLARAGGPTVEASLSSARLLRVVPPGESDREFERLALMQVSDMSESEYAYYKAKSAEVTGLVVVDFESVLAGDESEDVLLRDGDRIAVPRARETVTVSGRVVHPGAIAYVEGEGVGHYIAAAGGYASQANRGKVRIVRQPEGQRLRPREAGRLVPGDEIWVPEKPEANLWTTIKDVASFAASVATAYLLIDQATRN